MLGASNRALEDDCSPGGDRLKGSATRAHAHVFVASPIAEARSAVERARQLRAMHQELSFRCERSLVRALEACEVSRHLLDRGLLPFECIFYLRAKVDEVTRLAIWRKRRLIVHPKLAERAKLIVALGETFQVDEKGATLRAGLDEPVQAALTLVRAADQVLEFQLRLGELEMHYHAVAR